MQALQVFWQGINSEGLPCEGILIEAGGLEQIRQQLHHQEFFNCKSIPLSQPNYRNLLEYLGWLR